MLRDKLIFTPEPRGDQCGYRFTGQGTITELLTGLVPELSQAVASPTGFATLRKPMLSIGFDFDGTVRLAA